MALPGFDKRLRIHDKVEKVIYESRGDRGSRIFEEGVILKDIVCVGCRDGGELQNPLSPRPGNEQQIQLVGDELFIGCRRIADLERHPWRWPFIPS